MLDIPSALKRLGGDHQLFQEIAQCFMDDCPKRIASLRQAIAAKQWEDAARIAHTFRSGLGSVGADERLAFDIEDACSQQDGGRAQQYLDGLESGVVDLMFELALELAPTRPFQKTQANE